MLIEYILFNIYKILYEFKNFCKEFGGILITERYLFELDLIC